MNEIIAYCGLDCYICGAYQATLHNDDRLRAEVAATWSEKFNIEFRTEDINCDGCFSEEENLFKHCLVCEIRKCGKGKGVKNCAHCFEYPCSQLSDFFTLAHEAKTNLDAIRADL